MDRRKVYSLIDGERRYQDTQVITNPMRSNGKSPKSVGEYLVMLDHYLRRAQDDWTQEPGEYSALDEIRKIAAICVHCMEEHDAPPRIHEGEYYFD